MKRIVQCYFPIEKFRGFGEFLASTMSLHDFCSKRSIEVFVSYAKHDLIQSLMVNTVPVDIPIEEIPVIQSLSDLESLINDETKDTAYICFYYSTLLTYDKRPLFEESIQFVKEQCLNVTKEVLERVEEVRSVFECNKHEYVCLHVRVGDGDLVHKIGMYKPLFENIIKNIDSIVKPELQYSTVVVVSDSDIFKTLLQKVYSNMHVSSATPAHLGIHGSVHRQHILDTIVDFFLLAHSSKIIIISSHHQHPLVASYFSKVASFLYDVPVIIQKIHLEIYRDKCDDRSAGSASIAKHE